MHIYLPVLVMLAGLALNLPVFASMFLAVLVYFIGFSDLPVMIAVQRLVGAGENSVILAVPFFIMVGSLLNYSGIAKRMLALADVLTGRMSGGLAQANVLLSALMGGISASNLADCAMTCKVLVPEMTRLGYPKAFSAAVTAASCLITPILPPGIALIIYGFVADVSIGKMFMAGVVPGLLCCAALMFTTFLISKKRRYKPSRDAFPTFGEFAITLWKALPGLVLVLAIIGGIRLGVFTPTEAGAFAVVFVAIVGVFVYREMRPRDMYTAALECARSTAAIMLVIMTCSAFSWFLSWEQVTQQVSVFITTITTNPVIFLIFINLFMLSIGMFIEGNALLIVLVPILKPAVVAMNIDLIHFGIIVVLNLAIGTLTPPVGTVTLLACNLTKTDIGEFYKELLPYFITLLVLLVAVTYIPAISIWLPSLMTI